jgi:transposase
MEVIHQRCAGVDVSKKDAKVCVRVQGRGGRPTTSTVTTWTAVTARILDLKEHLLDEHVSLVVMEATSDYWRPFYYLLEDDGLDVILVNARDARNVPGRKTDVSDAAWLADLGAHGLVRASFVPPPPVRELRDLTRARTVITRERTREVQRLEKLLEDACIKLSSVASEITGVSGRLMLQALVNGERDPAVLAELAHGRMRSKIPELTDALTGRFSDHHRYMAELYLHRIDAHTRDIDDLSTRIEAAMEPFRFARELLTSIPGFSTTIAEVFIAETGADMTVFLTPQQLASWAGTSPGANESAGRVKATKTRPGNRYLKAPSASQHSRRPGPTARTYRPNTGASHPGADPSRRSSQSNTPCSPRPGTCSPPESSTGTPEPTTSSGTHPPKRRPVRSDNSNHSATKSPSNP